VALTAEGRTLAAGTDGGAITLWDVAGRKEVRTIRGHRGRVDAVCFAPDGKRLVSAGDTEARLWDLATGKELHRWTHGGFLVRSAVFTPDGKGVLTGGWDGTARLWDARTGTVRARFRGQGGLDGVLLHPDTHTLALWSHGRTVALFDLDLRPPDAAVRRRVAALVGRLDDDSYPVRESASAALKSLGWVAEPALRKAAKGSGSAEVRIRARAVLTALESEPRRVLKGLTADLRAACFSRDGKLFAAGAADGTVRLWNPGTGRELAVLGR
jgi:WD40 repeat protein